MYDETAYDIQYLRVSVTCRPELPAEEHTEGRLMLLAPIPLCRDVLLKQSTDKSEDLNDLAYY